MPGNKEKQTRGNILVVDDNPTNVNLLVDFLTAAGFDVSAAEDGQSALDLMAYVAPDIILLDVMMPEMDGFATCQRIKADPQMRDIPVIFMTALTNTADKIRGFDAGAVDYITKPVQHTEVLARVNTHLALREMRARLQAQNAQLEREIEGRKSVEAALRSSEERYRVILDNLGEGIAIADVTEKITFANPAADRIFGVEPGFLIGHNLADFLAPDQFSFVQQQTEKRLTGETGTYELSVTRPNGEVRHLLVTAAPWFDDDGRVRATFGIFRDITKRKQTEAELHKLSLAIEQSPSTVMITNHAGIIEYVNPKYTQVTGYAAEEVIGQNILTVDPDDVPRETVDALLTAVEAGKVWRGEYRDRRKDGTPFWEMAAIAPIVNADGESTHLIKVAEDISERKYAEDALRQYTHTLAQLNELGQKLTAILNPQQVAEELSRTATKIIGTESVSVWLLETNENDSEQVPELVCWTSYHHFQSERKHSPVNMRLPLGEGIVGWVAEMGQSLIVPDTSQDPRFFSGVSERTGFSTRDLLAVPLRVRDTVIGVLEMINKRDGVFDDDDLALVETLAASVAIAIDNARLVEALRMYTVELEAQNSELDAFAHTVAHDLKNPLSALLITTALLDAHYAEMQPSKIQTHLSLLTQTGRKMTDIIDELLLLASVRKMAEVEIGTLDMKSIVRESRQRLQDLVDKYQARIVEPDVWPVVAGYGPWVEEVWTNYISNAIKYGGMPQAGIPPRVELGYTLSPASDTDHTRFWVRDNGPGLTSAQQSRLFAPFERLSQQRIEGHGLGLSIVRRIVEKLGGQVGVDSRPGRGSTFYFTLPQDLLATETAPDVRTRPAPEDTRAGIWLPKRIARNLPYHIPEQQRIDVSDVEAAALAVQPFGNVVDTAGLPDAPDFLEESTAPGRILVVDDTPANLFLLQQMLDIEGYDVVTANNGGEALAYVQTELPDLILLDVNMPQMTGYEVCEHLKADQRTREIPVLFISALSQTKDKVKAFTAGGVDYVVKPFQPEEVLARVKTHLTLRELQRQLVRYAQHLEQMVAEKVRELERERSKIVQMDKMAALGQMATGVAHELNQPLTAISFEADYLLAVAQKVKAGQMAVEALLDVVQLEEMGDNLRGDVERCRRIIDHLRTFGRTTPETGGPVGLNKPIEDCFILVGTRLKNHNVDVNLTLDDDLPDIQADTHRLEQVFLNLIGNAEHALDKMVERAQTGEVVRPGYRKAIEIATYVEGNAVVARVRDNGCGISEEVQRHIFEPFFTTKPVGEGTGLGLSISYGIVNEFGGEITFESHENQGTTFWLRFPVAGNLNPP